MVFLALLSGYFKHVSIIMIIIIFHELGHVFLCILFKVEVSKVEIYPFGGLTSIIKRIHERLYKDVFISLGGILFQVLLYFVFRFLYEYNLIVLSSYNMFLRYNASVMLFNILPIIPLDGSKLLFTILNKFISYRRSYYLMIIISCISLVVFIGYNTMMGFNDIVIYIFLVFQLFLVIKELPYILNKFYLERIMYDHYYNKIISRSDDTLNLRIDKYYYFYNKDHYINEKDYIRKKLF